MRSFIFVLLAASIAHAASSISEKTRAEMDKLDARMSVINFSVRQNSIKLAQLKTDATMLQEKVSKAKDPDNRARLETAFSNTDEKRKACAAQIAHQLKTVNDLLTTRRLLSGATVSETAAERNAHLGVEKPQRVAVDLPVEKLPHTPEVPDFEPETDGYADALRESLHHKKN